MRYKRFTTAIVAISLFSSVAMAQKTEVTVSLNEQFFDALLDSIFLNFGPPEFPIARGGMNRGDANTPGLTISSSQDLMTTFLSAAQSSQVGKAQICAETVKMMREMNGVRTAVRFRDGKVSVPLAFAGNYNPPFVGCVEFAGWADAVIDLEFDQNGQRLIGKVKVLSVNLNGTGGMGGTLIARMVQGSLDKKLNPIEIFSLEKLSFGVPVQNSGNLRMKAVGIRPEVGNGMLNIRIDYQFSKG